MVLRTEYWGKPSKNNDNDLLLDLNKSAVGNVADVSTDASNTKIATQPSVDCSHDGL